MPFIIEFDPALEHVHELKGRAMVRYRQTVHPVPRESRAPTCPRSPFRCQDRGTENERRLEMRVARVADGESFGRHGFRFACQMLKGSGAYRRVLDLTELKHIPWPLVFGRVSGSICLVDHSPVDERTSCLIEKSIGIIGRLRRAGSRPGVPLRRLGCRAICSRTRESAGAADEAGIASVYTDRWSSFAGRPRRHRDHLQALTTGFHRGSTPQACSLREAIRHRREVRGKNARRR